jgi:signal transduction histidine kinase
MLRCAAAVGAGPRITHGDNLQPVQEQDWSSWFCDGESKEVQERYPDCAPSCLPYIPHFPFAWLPLQKGEQRLGVFVLTYPRPHFFVSTEIRVLEMFAHQCASSLENALMTLELRAAYERQKELDRLKDQFIVTASHELRTPLTAVQGYIELLHEYNTSLSPEMSATFIEKAQRGCDELALMVSNIMDASHVQIDAIKIKLDRVPLVASVTHVLEILDVAIRSEERIIALTIPPELCVMADDMRLRQVLLNLLNNALKYSPAGSSVEISTEVNDEWVTVYIRDYGSGVPLEEQCRLFERFVRLERDMNSPVRGAGLGLYLCKQLVEAMGGRIWMESRGRPDEGSIFAFTLNRVMGEVSEGEKVVSQWQV